MTSQCSECGFELEQLHIPQDLVDDMCRLSPIGAAQFTGVVCLIGSTITSLVFGALFEMNDGFFFIGSFLFAIIAMFMFGVILLRRNTDGVQAGAWTGAAAWLLLLLSLVYWSVVGFDAYPRDDPIALYYTLVVAGMLTLSFVPYLIAKRVRSARFVMQMRRWWIASLVTIGAVVVSLPVMVFVIGVNGQETWFIVYTYLGCLALAGTLCSPSYRLMVFTSRLDQMLPMD